MPSGDDPKSAKPRNRGVLGATQQPWFWGFAEAARHAF